MFVMMVGAGQMTLPVLFADELVALGADRHDVSGSAE
jgi:hypothetical protein